MLGFVASLLVGCSGTETAPPPEPEPVVEPVPEPEPEPVAAEPMTPAALNADRDAQVGKMVTVKGFYSNMTKQDAPAQINVPVYEDAELAGDSVLCVFDVAKEAELAALTEKQKLKVSGTVSTEKFLEKTKIDGCTLEQAGGEGADEAPVEGGDAAPAEGGEGEKEAKGKKKAKAH